MLSHWPLEMQTHLSRVYNVQGEQSFRVINELLHAFDDDFNFILKDLFNYSTGRMTERERQKQKEKKGERQGWGRKAGGKKSDRFFHLLAYSLNECSRRQ